MDKNFYENIPSSFEFYDDYIVREKSLQPDYYKEIERILNELIKIFYLEHKRKPIVLDVGSAGVIPYSPHLVESAIILDLFSKPDNLELPDNISWVVGNVLHDSTLNHIITKWKVDIIIASSLLHHLCDSKNNGIVNLHKFMSNMKYFKDADIYIFESVCSSFLAKLQDKLWTIQSYILNKIIGFTNVRMISYKELTDAAIQNGLKFKEINFTQPKYIAQFFIKVPLKFYPLRITAFKLNHKNGSHVING